MHSEPLKPEGVKAGVALIHTNVDLLEDVLNDIDLVCMMSVNPGFVDNRLSKIPTIK
jgi:ribulose-phosphate 3-epimerase